MHEHCQPNLPLHATRAATRKLTHRTMLLEVGKTQLHTLAAESIEALGLGCGHPRPMSLDQRFVFAAFDGSTPVRIATARDLSRARLTMLRRTTITMHDVDLAVGLASFLMADPTHRMTLF